MTTITLDEIELATIRAALRIFRFVTIEASDLSDLAREQAFDLASTMSAQAMTSENGDLIEVLEPAQIDDLIERLKPV
jgi:hypothetical protein